MNQIAYIEGKFKNLTETELLEVVSFYIDENKYFDSISFEKFYELYNKGGNFKRKDVEDYFTDNFYPLSTLKEFYKYWKN